MKLFLRVYELSLMETNKINWEDVLKIEGLKDFPPLITRGNLKSNESKKETSDMKKEIPAGGSFAGGVPLALPQSPINSAPISNPGKGSVPAGSFGAGMFARDGDEQQPLLQPMSITQQPQEETSESSSCWDSCCILQ
jgi:hypothetical protein